MKLTGLTAALGSAMGARLGMAALNYGLFWELSHRLAAPVLGGFSLLMNVFLLLQFMPLLGLSVPLIRRVATEREPVPLLVANAFAFALPVAGLLALAVIGWGRFGYEAALQLPFALVALSLLPTAWIIVAESTLIGLERVADISRVQFVEALLRTALAVLAVEFDFGLVGVFAVFLLVRVCTAAVYLAHPQVPRPRRSLLTGSLQRRNFAEVPVFLGITVLVALSARLDVIALAHWHELGEVGVYSAASRLYDAAQMVPTLTVLVLMPTLSRLFVDQPARFGALLALALRGCLGVGLLAALALAACADPLIALLYPPQMAGAAPVLRWLLFGAVLMTLDQLLSSTMVAAQAQSEDLRSLAGAAVLLAAALWLLVPRFGPTGAAAAVTLALLSRVLWRLHWAARALQLQTLWVDFARLAGAAAAGLAALALALRNGGPDAAPLALAAALLGFATAARLFGVFGAHPLREMRDGVARLTGRLA